MGGFLPSNWDAPPSSPRKGLNGGFACLLSSGFDSQRVVTTVCAKQAGSHAMHNQKISQDAGRLWKNLRKLCSEICCSRKSWDITLALGHFMPIT